MVAAVRGGQASRAAKTQTRAPSKPAAKSRTAAAPARIDPRIALACVGGALVLGLGVFLLTGDRISQIGHGLSQAYGRQMAKAGFKVAALHLQGASPGARADIIAATGVYQNEPIFWLDLDKIRSNVESIGWVEEARVVRLLPDTLVIHVKEQAPAAVWQNKGVLHVIDAGGKVIPGAVAQYFPQLPFLVGEGANEAAGLNLSDGTDILSLVRARPRLAERLEAVVRVDSRRWDLRLKDGAIVQLPAVGEESALIQLDQLDQAQRVLELGFERIDLRTPPDVVVRRREAATPGQLVAGGV